MQRSAHIMRMTWPLAVATLLVLLFNFATYPTASSSQRGAAAPGGVAADLALWLKADAGISAANGATVSTWLDQSGLGRDAGTDASVTAPVYRTSSLNGNPTVEFGVGGKAGLTLGSQHIFVTDSEGATIIAAVQPNGATGGARFVTDFGRSSDRNYGFGYSNSSIGGNTPTEFGGTVSYPDHTLDDTPAVVGMGIDFFDAQSY